MAHCQSPHALSCVHSYRKLCTTGEFFCSSGLKDGVWFNDVDKRVFHSTYRATHHLMASIAPILLLDDGSSRLHAPPIAEQFIHLEECIHEPEGPICIEDGAQQDSLCNLHNYVQTSIGCIDTQTEQEKCDGLDASTMLSSHSGASLLSSKPFQNGHASAPSKFPSAEGVDNPTTPCLCISYSEIQEPYGVSEFCIEHPEAPSTPNLQPEVKSWDSEGLGNGDAKDSFCTIKNVCIDDDKKESLVLEENFKMSACIGSCSIERVSFCTVENARNKDGGKLPLEEEEVLTACIGVCSTRISDVKDSYCTIEDFCNNEDNDWDSLALEENDIKAACIGGCLSKSYDALMQESEVVCTDDNSLYSPSYTSFACWKGANANHRSQKSKLSAYRWRRIWKVFNNMVISSADNFDTHTKKKLFFRSSTTSRFRLTLQRLVKLLKRIFDLEVAAAAGQLMAYTNIYLQVCRSRHLSTRGRRALAASCYSRLFLGKLSPSVGKARTRGDRHYKEVNVLTICQDYQKCHSRGKRNPALPKCLFLEQSISGIEQEGQYASMPPSVAIDSASTSSCLPEAKNEKFSRSTEPSSYGCDGALKILQGSLEHNDRGSFDMDHNLFSETNGGSTLKLLNLVEVRGGGMTRNRELSLDEFKEDIRESSGFPSRMSVNEVDDWTSIPANQVDECLDTCLYNLQHHPTCSPHDFTPELKILDPVIMGNPFKPANSTIDSLNDEGSHIFDVHANGNENNVSCLPIAGPHSHILSRCIASSSFDGEDIRSSMPYGRVHEKQSKEKLEHFAEGFLLRRHIRRQQRRAQQAPPYPPRDLTGYAHKNQGVSGKPLGDVKPKPYMIISIENNNEPGMTVASSITDNDHYVGADVVIDIVGLITYIESQCSQVTTFSDSASNSTYYTDMPLLGGQVVNLNIGAVIVTIIAILVYTRTLLEGGLAWVGGARTQKEEDN